MARICLALNGARRIVSFVGLAACTTGESGSNRLRPGVWKVESEALGGGVTRVTATLAPTGVGSPNLTVMCDSNPTIALGPLIPLIPQAEPGRATITYKFNGREPVTESWRREASGMRILAEPVASLLQSLRAADTMLVQFPGTDIGTGAYLVSGLDVILGARCRDRG
jgi:hypothetical protein